jgi:hypothetical protein
MNQKFFEIKRELGCTNIGSSSPHAESVNIWYNTLYYITNANLMTQG